MKRFYCFVLTLMLAVFTMNAQTVEHSKLFDNTYVTLTGGATTTGQFANVPTPFFWDGAKGVYNGLRPFATLELGKNITPAVGVSVEGVGFYGTTSSSTFVDELAVLGNAKLNLSNWLAGYKGQPRRVEFVLVGGLGYGHDFVGEDQTWTAYASDGKWPIGTTDVNDVMGPTDKNYVVWQAAGEMNFNLGKERAWQINLRPGVMWFNKYNGYFQSLPTWKHDARVNVQLGATYKFGKAGHHNFRLCPYSVTKAEYDALKAKYDELANREPEVREVVKETIKTETVTREVVTYMGGRTYITFTIGSVALAPVERAKIEEFAKNVTPETKVNIVGSADSKTGTETRNFALAQRRAEVVKNVLVNDCNVNADSISMSTALDVTDNVATSRAAVLALEIVDAD